jgi:hypothetical protein
MGWLSQNLDVEMTARIFRPAKGALQSGPGRSKYWILEFAPESPREIEPLMGWTSSGDMKSQIRLRFGTKEEAIAYAEKQGIAYQVEEPKPTTRRIMSYSDNFKPTRQDLWTH